ncbi:hypothetical protein [Caballeronia sp. dw_276]|uniref:hypothetical protein n=1 Tax=Caballeronia sp. dw_276 TaxID=2719795 RepID=UPI001BD51568|nr:hypothetical protein [Caballeronia sp. dw_276]
MPPKDEIAEAILAIKADLDQRHGENITRAQINEKLLNELIGRVDGLYHAFPDEDPSGHRRYHDAISERIEKRAKLYDAMLEELTKKGMWALISFVGLAVIYFIRGKILP